jgi:AcrR family transcriptional regulator
LPPVAPKTGPQRGPGLRAKRSADRREAIVAAALDEFSVRGFAATRLEDVAARAGVAKGTIYLYFRDKEALFQDIVRSMLSPIVGSLETSFAQDMTTREIADRIVELFVREIYGTRRRDVIRLILSEGARFPKLAEFYHREVLSKVFTFARAFLRRAAERGELADHAVIDVPQLLGAPGIVAIIWNSLFGRNDPLDVRRMLRVQFDLLFVERNSR